MNRFLDWQTIGYGLLSIWTGLSAGVLLAHYMGPPVDDSASMREQEEISYTEQIAALPPPPEEVFRVPEAEVSVSADIPAHAAPDAASEYRPKHRPKQAFEPAQKPVEPVEPAEVRIAEDVGEGEEDQVAALSVPPADNMMDASAEHEVPKRVRSEPGAAADDRLASLREKTESGKTASEATVLKTAAFVIPPRAESPSGPDDQAAWRRYSMPAITSEGQPVIAVVIDDVGPNWRQAARLIELPAPITLSFLPYAKGLPGMSRKARAAGHEVMLHLPMEPISAAPNPGPQALLTSLSKNELAHRIEWNLDRFDGYVGINNHMGSRFTAFAPGMRVVMDALKRRGLLFLDSRTTNESVGYDLAGEYGVPRASRNVFLDNVDELAAVRARLAETMRVARRHGAAIAIGHPHDNTINALKAWIQEARARGFALVPVSTIVARNEDGGPPRTLLVKASAP